MSNDIKCAPVMCVKCNRVLSPSTSMPNENGLGRVCRSGCPEVKTIKSLTSPTPPDSQAVARGLLEEVRAALERWDNGAAPYQVVVPLRKAHREAESQLAVVSELKEGAEILKAESESEPDAKELEFDLNEDGQRWGSLGFRLGPYNLRLAGGYGQQDKAQIASDVATRLDRVAVFKKEAGDGDPPAKDNAGRE